jgi:hypothetical protein
MLNDSARERMGAQGALDVSVTVQTERGPRDFAAEDRILFLRNERSMGVKNGTLGTVERASPERLAVRLDNGERVDVDLKFYAHVDHGYAATIHKSQGMTVDRSHVLATPGLDAHGAYVALSRHREGTALHYGRDDFADEGKLARTLARERPKDMALDYRGAIAREGCEQQSDRSSERGGTGGAARCHPAADTRRKTPGHGCSARQCAEGVSGVGTPRDVAGCRRKGRTRTEEGSGSRRGALAVIL